MIMNTKLTYYYYKSFEPFWMGMLGATIENTVKTGVSTCTCGKLVKSVTVKKYRTRKVIGCIYLCPDCFEICKPEEKGE